MGNRPRPLSKGSVSRAKAHKNIQQACHCCSSCRLHTPTPQTEPSWPGDAMSTRRSKYRHQPCKPTPHQASPWWSHLGQSFHLLTPACMDAHWSALLLVAGMWTTSAGARQHH
jgi:hypothetical protein